MRIIGFSTGAVRNADIGVVVETVRALGCSAIELSALRQRELPAVIAAVAQAQRLGFSYVSVHAPTDINADDEKRVAAALQEIRPAGINVVVHPDRLWDMGIWNAFGERLLVENMDRRKDAGRTAAELGDILNYLPKARVCFDLAHARQVDASLVESYRIASQYRERIAELHVSAVSAVGAHERLDWSALLDTCIACELLPQNIPVILESRVDLAEVESEVRALRQALDEYDETGSLRVA